MPGLWENLAASLIDHSPSQQDSLWNGLMQTSDGHTPNKYVQQNWPFEKWRPADIRAMTDYNASVRQPSASEVLMPFIFLHALRGLDTTRKDGDAMDFSPDTWLAPSRYRPRPPENV